MPFNIYADTLQQSEIVGVTFNKIDQDVEYLNATGTYTYIYEVEVLLKNKYVGVVDGTLSYSYTEIPNSQTITTSKRTYVNGDSFKLNVSIVQSGSYFTGSSPMYSASFLVNAQNTNVTKYEDLDSIETVVSVLQDIYTNSGDIENLSTNQLTELEKIVQNTSLANTYLDTISKFRQFNVPFESVPFIGYCFARNYEVTGFTTYNYWDIPLFKFNSGNQIASGYFYSGSITLIRKFILVTNKHANANDYQNSFTVTNGRITSTYEMGSGSYYIYVYDILPDQNMNEGYITITASSSFNGVPLFFKASANNIYDVSTDFGIVFRLNNQLLNDIHVIAQGTSASNQQSSDLSSGTDSMQDQMDDLVGIEDSYNQQFNNSVNSIDFNNPLQQNQGLLGASNFVITVFNGLIANNPFSILIIIVCILLIGKKVIGK